MATFFERLRGLRGAVAPALGRSFRSAAAVNARLDAENVLPGTLVSATRKFEAFYYFDVSANLVRYVDPALAAAAVISDLTDPLGFNNSTFLLRWERDPAETDLIQVEGISIAAPDCRFMFVTLPIRILIGATIIDFTLPAALDEADSVLFTAGGPWAVPTGAGNQVTVEVPAAPAVVAVGPTRLQTAAVVCVTLHMRGRALA